MKSFLFSSCLFVTFVSFVDPSVSAQVRYTDVTTSSGIRFQAENSATSEKYLIESMIGGVGVIDYDRDGWLDVFFVNGARLTARQSDNQPPDKSSPEHWNRMFHNNGDGTFSDTTEAVGLKGYGYGNGVAVGDYDNDGFDDLLVTNYGPSILYRNQGNGTFSDVTRQAGLRTEGWSTSAAFVDYDKDGDLDLFVCRYLEWSFGRNPYCGHKTPGGRAYCHPDQFPAISNYLFRNNGNGTFADVSDSSGVKAHLGYGLGVAIADFNNDTWPDIYVANDAFAQFLFLNRGDGTFEENGMLSGVAFTDGGNTFSGMGTDAFDMDDDGAFDILTTALSNETYAFFKNGGDGSFTPSTAATNLGTITKLLGGWGMHAYDYDNDGLKDVFLANSHVMDNIEKTQPHLSYSQPPVLLKTDGKKFHDVSAEAGPVFKRSFVSRGAAFGDLDNDGDVDVVVSNIDSPALVLRNDGGNANGWIGLDLRGTRSNRNAIGARIRITTQSGKVQHYQVTTACGYQSACDRRVFVGVGSERKIRELHITWPSGMQQTIKEPALRVLLKIEEPS